MICAIENQGVGTATNWLRQIEQQRAAEGREWARQKLEEDIQQQANAVPALCPKRGAPLRKTRWRPMQLKTSVGVVNVRVQCGGTFEGHPQYAGLQPGWGHKSCDCATRAGAYWYTTTKDVGFRVCREP